MDIYPTQKQLDYAQTLGLNVEILRGLTRVDVSRAIGIKVQERTERALADKRNARKDEIERRGLRIGSRVLLRREPPDPKVYEISTITADFKVCVKHPNCRVNGAFSPSGVNLLEESSNT